MHIIIEFAEHWYLTLKALHIIAIISWMAGMLYLPRLFVYHRGVPVGSPQSELFKIMERRLLKAIMLPAMIASFVLGALLMVEPGVWASLGGWFHLKLLAVFLLAGCHGILARWTREFTEDRRPKTVRFFRIFNEIPTLLMILIVFMVVLKPF